MPLEIFKRRHSRKCLADLKARIASGDLKIPDQQTEHTFLLHYPHCKCAWWIRGTNDYGKAIPVHSLKVYVKEAAVAEMKRLNRPDPAAKLRMSIIEANTADKLVERVQRALAEGWELAGGIAVCWMGDKGGRWYAQSIVSTMPCTEFVRPSKAKTTLTRHGVLKIRGLSSTPKSQNPKNE